MTERRPPLLYVESDLADGQTLTEWRASRRPAPRSGMHRIARRAVGLR